MHTCLISGEVFGHLGVGFYRPHTPYVAPTEYFRKHPKEKVELARFSKEDLQDLPQPAVHSVRRKKEQQNLPVKTQRTVIQAYSAAISLMDAQVGRLLDALDRLGMKDNTLIVFTSDHAYHMGEHGWWQKTTLFEESARVPLIFAGPGVPEGKSTQAIAELVDVYPTLTELAGLDSPGWVAGDSLVPVLEDPDASVNEAALTQLWKSNFSIRTERYRYTEWKRGEGGRELYDHENDPSERTNLANDPSHKETVKRLSKLLDEKLEEATGVPDKLK